MMGLADQRTIARRAPGGSVADCPSRQENGVKVQENWACHVGRLPEEGDTPGAMVSMTPAPTLHHPIRRTSKATHAREYATLQPARSSECRGNVMDEETSLPRRLAAILAADIAGYSRLMHEDEAATVRDLKAHQSVILPLVGRHGGRIIDTAGDGIMAEFPSVIGATECAVEIQTAMAERNWGVPESRRMLFRIGINLGDVIHDESRIYGDGINIAARLEALAEPGGVLASNTVYDQVRGKLPLRFEDLGERQVKNIEQPVRIYRLHIPGSSSGAVPAPVRRPAMTDRRRWTVWGMGAALLTLLGAGAAWWMGLGLPSFQASVETAQRRRVSRSSCCRSRI